MVAEEVLSPGGDTMTRYTASHARAAAVVLWLTLLAGLFVAGCDRGESDAVKLEREAIAVEAARESAPCLESATLLSTASGSPSGATCGDGRQRIVVTLGASSGANGFALATCVCRGADAGAR